MKFLRWLATVVLVTVVSAGASAQTDQGKLTGNVRDQSGAVVAGATITVTNERTAETRTATSSAQGIFFVAGLKPSSYRIRVEREGFSPIEYTKMPLAVGQELALDFEFKPAGVQEGVTVVADALLLEVSSAKMGVNVGEREVQSLPVNGRQMSQLMLQAPGSANAGQGTWSDIRFSGRAVNQNAIHFDGVEGSSIIDASPGQSNGEIATPFKLQASLENVQEFRVESSGTTAEYGTGTGGQINVITKSGSNAFHGAVFEYNRSDKFDSPNYFDSTAAGLAKTPLTLNQFGGSIGGPIARNRGFFFASYEAYRLDGGFNLIEAVPSAAAWARAVPAIARLRPGFTVPSAVFLPGASTNPDLDIYQLQAVQKVREDAISARLDFKISDNWSAYARMSHDQGTSDQPETVAGRILHVDNNPTNAVVNVQGVLTNSTLNEFKFGYNAAPTEVNGVLENPIVNGIDFSSIIINTSGSVANSGIAGQGGSTGLAIPGGLVRANSSTNGRGQPYRPYSVSFVDALNTTRGNHNMKVGGELRAIRMETDRLGGITYSFSNLASFLANTASTIDYNLDLSAPSPYNGGATGTRHVSQQYLIGYAQDEWRPKANMTLNYGLRYEYYTPLRERNDLQVLFDINTGALRSPTESAYQSTTNNFLPRVAFTYKPGSTLFRTGFGVLVGPGQTEDQIQTIESDRLNATPSGGSYPADVAAFAARFDPADPNFNNRNAKVRAYSADYRIPERVYQYTSSIQQELRGGTAVTVAYIGSQGRNLFLRSVTNQITQVVTNPNPASAALVIREFSAIQRDAAGNITAVRNPWAEIDYKTSGGHDQYNGLQLALSRRSRSGVSANFQYTLGKSTGNTGGSNEADTSANNARDLADFAYDDGDNKFDVRHTFNASLLYQIPFGKGRKFGGDASALARMLAGGWELGAVVNARSGVPINVLITRPDILYIDGQGTYFANPAAGRIAVINTPGGGNSRNIRRPNLVPGVDPFVKDGGTVFLNPAAFSIPMPGTFGDLERNSLHGPTFQQVDMIVSKKFDSGRTSNIELRLELFNLFNTVNFNTPAGSLSSVIPSNSATEANTLQPGQAYNAATAGTFGKITSTVGRTVGLGTSRQMQFALRINF
jgi:hypothetical protein